LNEITRQASFANRNYNSIGVACWSGGTS